MYSFELHGLHVSIVAPRMESLSKVSILESSFLPGKLSLEPPSNIKSDFTLFFDPLFTDILG